MTFHLHVSCRTDRGRVRSSNEDALLIADLTTGERWGESGASIDRPVGRRGLLVAVSDGMGGAAAGEIASALSLEALFDGLQRLSIPSSPDANDRLQHVVEWASEKVYEASRRPDRHGMGATLTAVIVSDGVAYLAQVGDSRAYLLRDGELRQVTKDQSFVQMLVDVGALTQEEAQHSPAKNVILQVMGQDQKVSVDVGSVELREGDRLLLCSDGLSNMVPTDAIEAMAGPPAPIDQATRALITAANDAGGEDNVTVVMAEVGPATES